MYHETIPYEVRDGRESFYGADKRVVTIGGGTGPFALLSRLKRYPCSISAIVTMSDSGGSSRRLMDEFGQLPFGDLRQALVALSRKGRLWRDIFGFRFPSGEARPLADAVAPTDGRPRDAESERQKQAEPERRQAAGQREVSGHSLGNLIISALESINEGDLMWALEDAQQLLDTAGKVFPVTLRRATLCAQLSDGGVVCGESAIDTRGDDDFGPLTPIQRIFLQEDVPACEQALRAIRRADMLILGPGDLYTSVLPNLLVRGVPEAIRDSQAEKVYVCNLMTKHGETDGFHASDFIRELHHYLGGRIDRVILHDGSLPPDLQRIYAAKQQFAVEADVEMVRDVAPRVTVGQFLAVQGDYLIRHDADRLIQAIFGLPSYEADMSSPSHIHNGFEKQSMT